VSDSRKVSEGVELLSEAKGRMLSEMGKVVVGQERVLTGLLAGVFSRGHCLLVGVPGLAKTLIVRTLSQILDLSFKRIQFTPDLMPSDITGTDVLDESSGRREFRFIRGPVFANIVLADEVNRAPPKTQAALLESMQERQVTVGQETRPLPDPFFVVATQNPIEQEGTYPLPEAQLDRFMLELRVDYPDENEEQKILGLAGGVVPEDPSPILRAEDILRIQRTVDRIVVSPYVLAYTSRLIRATRPLGEGEPAFVSAFVEWGAGPRAGQHLVHAAKALAAMEGRFNVSTSDIRAMAPSVLRHRISTNFQAQAEGVDSTHVINRLLMEVAEPDVSKYEES